MRHLFTILAALLFLYALVTGVFLVSENRRPQSTLAWMLVLFFVPGIGLLIYIFFGRDRKAFSKRSKLLMQDLAANALPLLSPVLSRQDTELARLAGNKLPDWAGNTYMADIVAAGVRVFLYEKGYLHAKTISIDSEICSIGSANIDIRSFSINYELNAVFYSERIAKQLERDFERDLMYCSEFQPAVYRKRGTVMRFRDSVARVLSPLL